MFELVEAIRFDRLMGIGRTKPMLLVCECNNEEIEVVAKFSAGCSIGGLIREAMTAMLALDLGLPVPAPYLIKLSPEFIESIPDPTVVAFLNSGDLYGFGSRRLPDGYASWIKPAGRMSNEMEQEALEILALDCWLTNGDRRVSNPNLLTNGNGFAIFDHELALMTRLNLFWQEPWLVNALHGVQPPMEHIFFEHLQARTTYALKPICDRFASLTEQRVNSYAEALPPSWAVETETVATAKTFIIALRNNLKSAEVELTRALS